MHIPPGFTTVFPYIFATDATTYLDFLRDGLVGEILGVERSPDGMVRNAHVRFADTTIMVSEAVPGIEASRATFYLYVENADAAMAQAVAAGGKQFSPLGDRPYQDRQGGVTDPSGNIWWLSQRLVAGPY